MIRTIEADTTGMRSKLRSLAMTQRRLSHQYRRWAAADQAAGSLASHRRNSAEALRLRVAAQSNLKFARQF